MVDIAVLVWSPDSLTLREEAELSVQLWGSRG